MNAILQREARAWLADQANTPDHVREYVTALEDRHAAAEERVRVMCEDIISAADRIRELQLQLAAQNHAGPS